MLILFAMLRGLARTGAVTDSVLFVVPGSYVQASCVDLNKRLTGAHESLAQAQLDLGEAQGILEHTRNKATAFETRCVYVSVKHVESV